MKKEGVYKDFQQFSSGMSQRCIDSNKKCSGCRQLENLQSHQVFGLWSTPISELKPVTLGAIVQELYRCSRNSQTLLKANRILLTRWYESRVVFGSLSADATRRGFSALTVIEADDGTTCIVQVFNAVSTACRPEELRKMFPKGIRVAISRPSVGTLHPSISPVILYVQSPASMTFANAILQQQQSLGSSLGPHSMRLEGNRLFSQGNYLLAAEFYTDCIAAIDARTRDAEIKKELVLAISNRAEAWLKLSFYERAIADANRAIVIDPLHAKSFFRKGRALMAIHEHLEARGSLKLAAKNSDGEARKEFMEALAKCKVFIRQSQKGDYDLGEFVSSGCLPENAPKCSDYVGPVEVRLTRDGRGRGLFVTKKVRVGELLLVSNSIALLRSETSREGPPSDYSDLFVESLKTCRSSRRAARQLYAIQEELSIPNMKIFKPNSGYADPGEEEEELDLGKIQRGVKAGFFPWSAFGEAENRRGRVWGLPAFINHSCLPNVSRLEVGKATFIHAARDMQAGEECVMCYVDPFASWNGERRSSIREWGFDCSCRRCSVEKSCQPFLREVPVDVPQGKIEENYSQLLQRMEARLASSGLSAEDQDLIRVALFDFYGPLCVGPSEKLVWLRKAMTPEKLIRLLHLAAPGHPKTLVYMSYLAKFGKNVQDIYQLLMDEFTAAYGTKCASLAWKVLKFSEGALENFMEATFGNVRICKCWFAEDDNFRVECLL